MRITILLFFLLQCLQLFPQLFSFDNKPVDITTRQLIIIETGSDEINEKKVKKKGLEALEFYHQNMKLSDENLVDIITDYWQHHSEFQILPYDSVSRLYRGKSKSFVVLEMLITWPEKAVDSTANLHTTSTTYENSKFHLYLIEDMFYEQAGLTVTLPHVVPYPSDIKFGLDRLTYLLVEKSDEKGFPEVSKRTKTLKDKTLIFCKDQFEADVTEEIIRSIYPYEFILTDREKYEELVFSGNASYAIVYNDKGEPYINDCKTGVPLFYDFDVYETNVPKEKLLDSKDLKDLVSNIKFSSEGKMIR